MALSDAINELIDQVIGLAGIRAAPDEPPDDISVFPFIVTYAGSGTWNTGTAGGQELLGLHDVVMELHVARRDLPRDYAAAMKYSNNIPDALFKAIRDSTYTEIDTFGDIFYQFTSLGWGGVDTIGWRFTIRQVKTRDDLTA